jgi:ribonuclease T2
VRRTGIALALWLVAAATARAEGQPGDLDFYVLALSWSPAWCATASDASRSSQCEVGAGRGFVLHGLWPQFDEGYPEFCDGAKGPPPDLLDSILDIMPGPSFVRHQWKKHGTCSGLDAETYFATARAAFERIVVPRPFNDADENERLAADDIETAFAAANPGLQEDGIAVICDSGVFEEVRICLTRDLGFRPCAEVDARGCRQRGLRLPAPD